jgi:hypothetical protein
MNDGKMIMIGTKKKGINCISTITTNHAWLSGEEKVAKVEAVKCIPIWFNIKLILRCS